MAMHAKVVDIIITIIIIMIIIHVKVVDVFLVQESNFTNSGEGRPLEMLKKLEGGWLEEHVEKLVYLLRLLVVAGYCKGTKTSWSISSGRKCLQEGLRTARRRTLT